MKQTSGKLLFSIAVHEKPETIVDQIENILTFNPNSLIVLHISKQFSDKSKYLAPDAFYSYLNNNPNVYINDQRLSTSKYSPGQTHCSNFLYASKKIKLAFDYFVLLNSNDLFIKPGFANQIGSADYGIEARKYTKHWAHYKAATMDDFTKTVIKNNSLDNLCLSYLEGTFFARHLFSKICDALVSAGIFTSKMNYPQDELTIPSLAKKIGGKEDNFRAIKNGNLDLFVNLKTIKQALKDPLKFGVKRIDRDFDDPYRIYIRERISKTTGKISQIIALQDSDKQLKGLYFYNFRETLKQVTLFCVKRIIWAFAGKKRYKKIKEKYLSKKTKKS